MATIFIPPILMFLFFIIYYFFPPKRINRWYGYRTSYSMQNQKIWDYANRIAAKYLLIFSVALLVCDVILKVLLSNIEIAKTISFSAIILGLVLTIIFIERKIRKQEL
jgi:uncharacterized membrane protein